MNSEYEFLRGVLLSRIPQVSVGMVDKQLLLGGSFRALQAADFFEIGRTEIGKALSEQLNLPWSDATNLRRGNALRKWVRWAQSYSSKL